MVSEPTEVSPTIESFVRDDVEYLFMNSRVTWEEAKMICNGFKRGALAIINVTAIGDFLADALSETSFEMEDLWIGGCRGYKDNKEVYYWLNDSGVYEPDERLIMRGSETAAPNALRNCLAFSRQYHDEQLFVNLECHLRRKFMCQRRKYYCTVYHTFSSNTSSVFSGVAKLADYWWQPVKKFLQAIFF